MLDLVIVGAGPIGLACAIEAQKKGLNYLVLEKGCLVNSLFNYPQNMTFFSTSDLLEIGNVPFVSNNSKPTRTEALEYYRRVALNQQLKVNIFEEVVAVKNENSIKIIETNKNVYKTQNLIIATGFFDIPFRMNVPGEDLPKVTHYYKDPHYYAFQKVCVVGANNSAVDAALETWRKGAQVTMVIRGEDVGSRVKYWARPDILNRIKEGSIKAFFESEIVSIKENTIDIQTKTGIETIENDWVIAMTGYQPNLNFLQNIGIDLSDDESRKPQIDEVTHESNVPGIYLAGVICGGMDTHTLFIENSRIHAQRIIEDVISKK